MSSNEPTGASSPLPEPQPPRRWPRVVALVLGVGAVAAVVVTRQQSARAAKEKGGRPDRAIPVATAPVRTADVPVTLTGLGTVTPLNTVTVRTRIDGQLMTVAYREGQLVKAGDLLAEIDPRPYQVQLLAAEGQLARDEAALQNARLDLVRYRTLAAEDAIARQQLDTQGAVVMQGEAAVKSDRAAIESAKLNLTYCRITAPFGGRVGLRVVDPGNMVRSADASGIAVVTQVQPIAVTFTLPADQLPSVLEKVRGGEKLAVDALDREMRKVLARGALDAIDNQIDPATGTVKLKARFANEDGSLYPNQFVNARLLVETLKGAVVAPTAALQRSPQGAYVWLATAKGTAELRPVETRLTDGDVTVVKSGLAPGDAVVVDGTDKLQPGAKVTTAAPGGAPGGPGGPPKGGAGGPKKKDA